MFLIKPSLTVVLSYPDSHKYCISFKFNFSGPDSGQHLRLTGGNEIHAGFLEIKLYSGAPWTKVCKDSYWNSNTATVACRELGYDLGTEGSHSKEFNSNSYDLEPLKLNCEGNEKKLQECKTIKGSHCSRSGQALFLGELQL